MDRREPRDLGSRDFLLEVKEALKENKDKAVFITEYYMAIGLQAEIDKIDKKEWDAKTIGVKPDEDIDAMESVLKEELDKEQADKTPRYPFILAFEKADKKQRDLNEKIIEMLKKLEIKYVSNPLELMRKEGFKTAIPKIVKMATSDLGITEKSLNDINAYKHAEDFIEDLASCANAPAIKTGFEKFDEALGGGLRAGRLYGIGAITSLGKTTFALQIADNMARKKQDVLIFSLEMSIYELMGKSVSRGTYIKNRNEAISLQSILDPAQRADWSEEKKKGFVKSIADYEKNVAKHINIIEGVGDIGCKQIRECVEKFCVFKNSNPVVIIDYLQILASFNDRLTDKQSIDKNVLELKRICRDYQVPVIVINSFNRTNYLSEASFEAFKESGAIEYSCDVLIALQLYIAGRDGWTDKNPTLNEKREAVNNAKLKSPRDVEAIILKNRGYKPYEKVFFHYTPEYDYFEENPEPTAPTSVSTPERMSKRKHKKGSSKLREKWGF